MNPRKLILASASPRRRTLLDAAGVAFEVVESGVDESRGANEAPTAYCCRMAREKALAVSRTYPEAIILGADTIVVLDDQLLLKPACANDAQLMLQALSDRSHIVVTAFALAARDKILEIEPVLAQVTFKRLSVEQIDDYIRTGDPFDKAGAYGIQDRGAEFIARVEGSRDTVMGLPVAEVLTALRRHGFHA